MNLHAKSDTDGRGGFEHLGPGAPCPQALSPLLAEANYHTEQAIWASDEGRREESEHHRRCADEAGRRLDRAAERYYARQAARQRAALPRRQERPRAARRRVMRAGARKAVSKGSGSKSDSDGSDPPGTAPLAGERVLHAELGDEILTIHLIDTRVDRADELERLIRATVNAAGGSMLKAVLS